MKLYKLLANLCADEDRVLCFLCNRRLRPVRFDHILNAIAFSWLRKQYTVGFTREVTGEQAGACDDSCAEDCGGAATATLEVTVCLECGTWANQHPVEGEMVAKARLASIQSGKQ